MENATVKLDAELLKQVKKLISQKGYRIQYANLKQFVNIAVLQWLEKEKGAKENEPRS